MGETLDLTDADIVMMGGGSDRDQLAVAHELLAQKDKVAAYVEDGGSLLAICGSYQLLGRSYYMGEDRIEGLGVIAAETVRGSDRLIGNVAVKTDLAPEPLWDSRTTAAAPCSTQRRRRSERPSSWAPATTATMALRAHPQGSHRHVLTRAGTAQEPRARRLAHRPRPRTPWRRTGRRPVAAQTPRRRYEHAAHDAAMKLLP